MCIYMSAPCVTASRPVDMVASKVGTSRVVGFWLPCYEVSVNWNPHARKRNGLAEGIYYVNFISLAFRQAGD